MKLKIENTKLTNYSYTPGQSNNGVMEIMYTIFDYYQNNLKKTIIFKNKLYCGRYYIDTFTNDVKNIKISVNFENKYQTNISMFDNHKVLMDIPVNIVPNINDPSVKIFDQSSELSYQNNLSYSMNKLFQLFKLYQSGYFMNIYVDQIVQQTANTKSCTENFTNHYKKDLNIKYLCNSVNLYTILYVIFISYLYYFLSKKFINK